MVVTCAWHHFCSPAELGRSVLAHCEMRAARHRKRCTSQRTSATRAQGLARMTRQVVATWSLFDRYVAKVSRVGSQAVSKARNAGAGPHFATARILLSGFV